jgi:hypothetical protein
MNDPTSDPRDELASALLDGESSAEEAARVAADPELAARVAAFEEVRSMLRAEVPSDPARRDAAVAAALAAFDEEADAAGLGRGAVTPISAARRGRLRWAQAVGVAAAAVLVAAVVPMLLDGDGGGEDTATPETALSLEDDGAGDRAAGEDEAASAFDADTAAPGAAGGDGNTALSAAAVADLGAHEDLAGLTAAARAALDPEADRSAAPLSAEAAASPPVADCLRRTGDGLLATGSTAVALQGTAMLEGVPVVLVVGVGPDGSRVIVVARPDDGCTTVAREALPG